MWYDYKKIAFVAQTSVFWVFQIQNDYGGKDNEICLVLRVTKASLIFHIFSKESFNISTWIIAI